MPTTVKVRVTLEVTVELPEGHNENLEFLLEENGCPGTGAVGARIEELIDKHDEAGTCWACACQGENYILEVDGKEYKHR